MDGQTGLKLDDNWEIICPWAQIMVGTTMPVEVTENMIELTDEILERENKEDYGEVSSSVLKQLKKIEIRDINRLKTYKNLS